jgi:hypothetical protein
MMDLAWAASNGQAPTTIAKSASSAALSAALLNKISDFPDDFAVVAVQCRPIVVNSAEIRLSIIG